MAIFRPVPAAEDVGLTRPTHSLVALTILVPAFRVGYGLIHTLALSRIGNEKDVGEKNVVRSGVTGGRGYQTCGVFDRSETNGQALARGWRLGLAYSEVRSLHRDPFPATGALHEVAWPANSIDHMRVLADKTLPGAILGTL